MRAHAGSANLVVALCPPLTLFFSSNLPVFTWIGYLAIWLAAIATVVCFFWSRKKLSTYTMLIGSVIICMIIVGWVPHDFRGGEPYLQVVQLVLFGVIISDIRQIAGSNTFHAIALLLVCFFLITNFTESAWVELIKHDRTWASPVFQNSNTFGYAVAILTIFCFLSSKVVNRPRRVLTYPLFVFLLFFIAASGSRGGMLMVVIFFLAYLIGRLSQGNRAVLSGEAALVLLMVPAVTFGYPLALGAHINLIPPPTSPDSSGVNNIVSCGPTVSAACPGRQEAAKLAVPDRRAGGFLGLKKHIGSGREKIWPAVIELAGRSPVWGHGLGASPVPYLALSYPVRHAHSDFLQVYYEFGLIGVALYAFLWCILVIRAIRVLDPDARSTAVAVLCATCVLETLEVVLMEVHLGMAVALGILATTEFTTGCREPRHADLNHRRNSLWNVPPIPGGWLLGRIPDGGSVAGNCSFAAAAIRR